MAPPQAITACSSLAAVLKSTLRAFLERHVNLFHSQECIQLLALVQLHRALQTRGGVLILFVNRRRNEGLSAHQSGSSEQWALEVASSRPKSQACGCVATRKAS